MKKNFTLMSFFIAFNTYAFELEYKRIHMDIPDSEVTGVSVAVDISEIPSSLIINGKAWWMGFSDAYFKKDCTLLSNDDQNLTCKKQVRIPELDLLISKENSVVADILFSKQKDDEVKRQEYKDYVLYTSTGKNKMGVAFLVEKKTGRTIDIQGKFQEKHLEWLRLEPLESKD